MAYRITTLSTIGTPGAWLRAIVTAIVSGWLKRTTFRGRFTTHFLMQAAFSRTMRYGAHFGKREINDVSVQRVHTARLRFRRTSSEGLAL